MDKHRRLAALAPLGLFVLLASCTPSTDLDSEETFEDAEDSRSEIVNGTPTSDYPATGVMINGGQSWCTGTVISPRKVLTAAHCVENQSPSQFTFAFGPDAYQPQDEIQVIAMTTHPQWDSQQLANDIAILTLASDAGVAPIPLNPSMDSSWIGTDLLLVGYGVSNGPNQTGGGVKRMVDVSVSQLTATTLRYETTNGKSACNGDSGGPAFLVQGGALTLVGVTSYGDQNCQQYGVYTRVDAFLDFIEAEIAADPGQPPTDPGNPNPPTDPNDPGQPTDPNDPGIPDPTDPADCDYVGFCVGDTVVWCEFGLEFSIDCDQCGFNPQAGYYDCL